MWARSDLLAELKGLGLLRSREVERSFSRVSQESFLPEPLASLAYADMPLPVHMARHPSTMPSARCLVAALDLLEPEEGLRILIAGCRGGYPGALLAEIAGPERVVIVETDPERRDRTAERLAAAGLDAVRLVSSLPSDSFDRILVLDATPTRSLVGLLSDPGFLIARGRGVHDLAFVKLVREGGETAQMTFNEAPAAAGSRDGDGRGRIDFGRLLAVEDLLAHAWEGRVTGHYDEHFQEIVDETFSNGPLDASRADPSLEPRKDAARRAFHAAYILQSAGELGRAADAYERSIRLEPSAEAHTFLGWALSFLGRFEDAIEACRKAIEVDPDFGNPYNDIGAYLIELGRLDEAIPWLEKATDAPRYCCYFYAHTNLARVYLQKGLQEKARKALEKALEVNPDYEPARELLRRVDRDAGYFG
ncbi:MAG TPA: tetratricopeptide repeat protein [Thermoplasmata archaeon]|jgi:protein-L-isoaspartate O-methyltransferase|nr:tetratricopeptide repeat protein [Thermoplasmata archaeon]